MSCFGSQKWAHLSKVTVFGPKKMALLVPNRNSEYTFIVQTFPKYGPEAFIS